MSSDKTNRSSDTDTVQMLLLSPAERERQKESRARALNARYIPQLRVIGSVIIAVWLYLHMRYISGGTVALWTLATAVLFAHAFAAWAILHRFYRLGARFDLSLLFLNSDLLLWTWLIYITGAEESYLFFLLSVRAADQSPTTFRRTFYFAHAGTLLYVGMLAVLYLSDRPVDWGSAWSKAGIIYGFSVYLSLAARTTEGIRRRMASAIQLSRELIDDLEQKRHELSEALTKSAELERSLAQAQKLDSLGHMATGIAHDFNNTMMSALPWADLVARKGQNDPELQHAANRIRSAISRAREVTSQLLGFAQPKRPELQQIQLGHFLRQELQTLQLSVPEDVQIRIDERATGTVEIDPSMFSHVLLNLTLNARDAMPDGGVLTFTVRQAKPGEHNPNVAPDTFLALDISDTGTGIDPSIAATIFDPFFTTKPFGKGTGLGLSVVHRTMSEAGGYVYVRSTPGSGSTFTLLLPGRRAEAPAVVTAVAPEPDSKPEGLRVMVVDDDHAVLEGLELMLELSGAVPTTRDSGADAITLLDSGFEPDVIILDLGMPGMSGTEVHAAIRERGLRMPIVISSGYGERERIDRLLSDGLTLYLQKPYSLHDLEQVLAHASRIDRR